MGNFRLFRRIKIAPGVTINLSKSGLSSSVGPKGAKVTVGRRGVRTTVGVPGTGLSYTSTTKTTKTTKGGRTAWPLPDPAIGQVLPSSNGANLEPGADIDEIYAQLDHRLEEALGPLAMSSMFSLRGVDFATQAAEHRVVVFGDLTNVGPKNIDFLEIEAAIADSGSNYTVQRHTAVVPGLEPGASTRVRVPFPGGLGWPNGLCRASVRVRGALTGGVWIRPDANAGVVDPPPRKRPVTKTKVSALRRDDQGCRARVPILRP